VLTIDAASAVPPFEQVRAGIAHRIATGELAVGTRLPTVRQLALDLGLAANTVARAYRELEIAGLVVTRGRAGSFVDTGDTARRRAYEAAQAYAAAVRGAGMSVEDAVGLIRTALAAQ
jgi:DNA-binding transcriptional regulator YhcF (GntR family)